MFDPSTKILVVDDATTMRKMIIKMLKDMGFTDIAEAQDGTAGWESISNAKPGFGLVVSDWNMPKCTGIDLLRRVRADSRTKQLPFLMVTAEAEVPQVSEAIKAGVDGYIVKPFVKDTLQVKIGEVHKKRFK